MSVSAAAGTLQAAQALLAGAQKVTVLSGAGLSCSFWGPVHLDGHDIWRRPLKPRFLSLTGLLEDGEAFQAYWETIRDQLRDCPPGPAHHALKALEGSKTVTHLTQNIDGLLQRVGCSRVIELFGNIWTSHCAQCKSPLNTAMLQGCPLCTGVARPDVLLYGELLDPSVFEQACAGARACDLFIVVGTQAQDVPAVLLVEAAFAAGVPVLAINPELGEVGRKATVYAAEPAEQFLPSLVRLVQTPSTQAAASSTYYDSLGAH